MQLLQPKMAFKDEIVFESPLVWFEEAEEESGMKGRAGNRNRRCMVRKVVCDPHIRGSGAH